MSAKLDGEARADRKPLCERIESRLVTADAARAEQALADLRQSAAEAGAGELLPLLDRPAVDQLLRAVLGASPYLTGLCLRDPKGLSGFLAISPEASAAEAAAALNEALSSASSAAESMTALRRYKSRMALLVALADLAGAWSVDRVVAALTEAADRTINGAVRFLLRRATRAGDLIADDPERPDVAGGYIVIGMGKYGAGELNYSSDVDLIVFYDLARVRLREGIEPSAFFVRVTRELVRLMQERTADGYVFRVDLRLRPDPGATQVALSTNSALHYYESFGQNWERAALIKARAVAGDIEAGRELLSELAPYVWRKYLDYAAIADIHAMKRQIHAFKGFGEVGVAGHNIKLGRGGIREIEFFAQTQQLIAGGRQTELRTPRTLEALDRLAERKWINPAAAAELQRAYRFLRSVEHRLQMISDEQTQTLPREEARLRPVACLSGFADVVSFGDRLRSELLAVQRHYAQLFEAMPELTRKDGGNLVFTGDDPDPTTVETLRSMGFKEPQQAWRTVSAWHFGRYPAMRSARARERLTELHPVLLEVLASTSDPDAALVVFDRFLSELPAGVQLFSLLRTNPGLLRMLADIMGSAPRLANILGRRTQVLDAVLDPGFFGSEPTPDDLAQRITSDLAQVHDYPDKLDRARVIGNEQAFLIGVRVLTGTITADRAGGAYATLAECLIAQLQRETETELARVHGRMPGGAASVIAMGKLGGREMAANSDLDLIVVYTFDDGASASDGGKPLPGTQYYSRLTQRLISAIASPTAEGRLYEVDMRLRPSGTSGPVASHLRSFTDYQREAAWTWEHMALTRARVITGPVRLQERLRRIIAEVLRQPRDPVRLTADVREMRERIATEKGAGGAWDLKLARGGLLDIEFIAQHLQLRHAHEHPEILDQSTLGALDKLARAKLLSASDAEVLMPAARLYQSLSQLLRLCLDGPFDPAKAPRELAALLAAAGDAPNLARLEADLGDTQAEVARIFENVIS